LSFSPLVVWHDVECGGYTADLPLWRDLAIEEAGPGGRILDVGAGTGRVTLDLAAAGFAVTALDSDPVLLAALAARAGGLDVRTVAADAASFALGAAFPLIIVPMQTVQLLPGRAGFLACAAAHLAPGGLLAVAVTGPIEDFDGEQGLLPAPDVGRVGGFSFASQPTAVRALPAATRIERVRSTVGPDGAIAQEEDVIELAHVTVARLQDEARAAGLEPEPARTIAPTAEHVGSEVVLLRG
jgi:SAM-dependent methyltransferase